MTSMAARSSRVTRRATQLVMAEAIAHRVGNARTKAAAAHAVAEWEARGAELRAQERLIAHDERCDCTECLTWRAAWDEHIACSPCRTCQGYGCSRCSYTGWR
jgi:hypothetical protein